MLLTSECQVFTTDNISPIDLFYNVFQARELKSIHLDAEGHFVKLVLHKNHVNKYNIYNQARRL